MANKSESNIEGIRHSLAHLLAASVRNLYPGAKNAIGPAIENGFYQDFELPQPISDADLPRIEKKMREVLKTWTGSSHRVVTPEEARKEFAWNEYKVELIDELAAQGKELTFYTLGNFLDLCKGGHSENPAKEIDPSAFKLDKIAGAYWHGDATKAQLTRIYGLAFATKAELDEYLAMRAEAEKRDHKILGKKLGLFTFSPEVGSGLPLYMPNGTIIREALLQYVTDLKKSHGYKFVWTPHLAKKALYIRSGHLGKYDAMLPSIKTEDDEFVLKPMNCPHHFQIYNAEPKSYKDLPYRIAENATDYRNEKSGELNGLFRVRSLTQDDTHHVIRHDQISSEIDMILTLTRNIYETFGFKNFKVEISARDPKNKSAYFGTDKMWDDAENALIEAAKRWGAEYKVVEGEAAFYGPKIDIRVEDALGRNWQLTTVQLDYNQPENFDMSYVDDNGQKVRPAVIHAALLGSVDRFMGIIIEQFAGAFPLWLSPVQATIIPVGEKFSAYGKKIYSELMGAGIRVEFSEATESLGKRIRNAEMMKIPYLLVVGEKEERNGTVAVRSRKGDEGEMETKAFIKKLEQEIRDRSI
jgi:threonyl-tRNA synthetase